MEPVLVDRPISKELIRQKAHELFGDFAKAVVDIEFGIMMVGGEMHVDLEQLLLEKGSEQQNLWGINLYPEKGEDEWIEFDSMINLRPGQDNRSRGVDNADTRARIAKVVASLLST